MEPQPTKPEAAPTEVTDKPELTLQHIEDAYPTKTPAPNKKIPTPDVFTKFLILEGPTHWLFRLGFASIFLVNAIYAALEPADFAKLLTNNIVANKIGFQDLMIKFTMFNDLLIGIFIIGGWRKRIVYAWAGAWLLMVAGLKLMNYIF